MFCCSNPEDFFPYMNEYDILNDYIIHITDRGGRYYSQVVPFLETEQKGSSQNSLRTGSQLQVIGNL